MKGISIPCKPRDLLWIADKTLNKVLVFEVDCIKIFEDNITAHGYRESGWGQFRIPKEYDLKHFGKRVIFATKEEAERKLITK